MTRLLTSSRMKAGLVLVGGTMVVAGGWSYMKRQSEASPNTDVVKTFLRKHFLTADSITHSVLDTRFQRTTPVPWDQNWDK